MHLGLLLLKIDAFIFYLTWKRVWNEVLHRSSFNICILKVCSYTVSRLNLCHFKAMYNGEEYRITAQLNAGFGL